MTGVAITGWGQTRFGDRRDASVADLAAEAAAAALEMAGLDPDDIEAGWLSLAYPNLTWLEGEVGSFLAEAVGQPFLPVTRVTNLCAGGLDAVRGACLAVRSGDVRAALVVGVEKMRDVPPRGSVVRRYQEETHPMLARGRTAPGMFALRAARYAESFGVDDDAFARVVVKNRALGARNPYAHHASTVSLDDVRAARLAADPLTVLECCPTSDGAAAVVLTADGMGSPRARIQAVGLSSDRDFYRCQFAADNEYLGFAATRVAAERAYASAGITPADIDIVECHDCFSVTEILDIEDLGLCERGDGWRLVRDGETEPGGSVAVNPSGGLIAGGHPVGATGVRMVADVARQVSGTAPGAHVEGARTGVAHALGGPGNVAAVAVMSAIDESKRERNNRA